MAFEFLKPVLTPNALATVQANPVLLAYLLGWLFAIIFVGLLAWYISFVTGQAYKKPAKKPDPKKAGAAPAKGSGPSGAQKLKSFLKI
ncbi:hypothetical protein BT63DRAFT_423965 [Microthyrium microscopicum]|uniref:Uncharacterized protein n=1 Tax=Microthyrium microscopicum TaxID=703497 RepID=A0A6A6UEX5_9PEZI|nr:hypothetical protein BT63DRAFT_423965 [Microthyrium microscopicum]